ncbi:MAG: hypothetical protein AAAB13_16070 [Pseudomonas sp.]
MLRACLLGLCLLLGACAAHTPVPATAPALVSALPLTLQIHREQAGNAQDWLLVVQHEGPALRWSLFDPLGVPLARQLLQDGAWHNDGLLPPNAEARELFAALLFALTPAAELAHGYAPSSWSLTADGQRRLNPAWQIRYRGPLDFTLTTPPGLAYQVVALPEEEGR